MIKGLTFVVLTTPDIPAARRFFTEKLGLTTEGDTADLFSQFATREGAPWSILKAEERHARHEIELYLQVDDPDAAYRTWQERGVEMVTVPHDEVFGRTFAFRDLDGRTLHAWRPS